MSNTSTYRRTHRELFRKSTQRWRERLKAENPGYALNSARKYRAENPNYHREWRARRKLQKAWVKFTKACAASRGTHTG